MNPGPPKTNPWDQLKRLREEKNRLVKRLDEIRAEEEPLRLECLRFLGTELSDRLTRREKEVLELLRMQPNLHNKELAAKLNISPRTVKFHLSRMFAKFEVTDRGELLRSLKTEEKT